MPSICWLEVDGADMRREPIEVRKATLASILPQDPPWRLPCPPVLPSAA
jgi:hypothetical protein